MRLQLIKLARKYARHGHMINITRQIMEEGMCADYLKISEVTHKVHERVRRARAIHVTNPAGTDLVVELDPLGGGYRTTIFIVYSVLETGIGGG